MSAVRRTARERRLRWAVGILCTVSAVIVTIVVVRLWSSTDQNVAGWITGFVITGAAWAAWESLGLSAAIRRASRRTQWIVIALALAFAIGGGVVYVLWPGTASWYLAALPAIPAILVSLSLADESRPADSGDIGDGPWTAP
jgi:peptidoglycan/LPS O-acetylase OafA/YrhL